MDFLKAKQACVYILSGQLNDSSVQLLHLLTPCLDYKIRKGNDQALNTLLNRFSTVFTISYC